ncbi:unnamed protein product [Haemonchus placei]|uniref:Uncharacterized protein n=1 Tax=Haemonchus placei TaxID=6290 RepID=A0A0N4WAE5_HAEPC|nr:unnamed protein product [Haemonchus placei]
MSSPYRPKHVRVEKETELFRIHLENTLTMDSLTGWIKKIVEVPPNKRPANVLKFFIENRNLWDGSIVNRAFKKIFEDLTKKIDEVHESNVQYKRKISDLETKILIRRIAALDAKNLRKKMEEQQAPASTRPLRQRQARAQGRAPTRRRSRSADGAFSKKQPSKDVVPQKLAKRFYADDMMHKIPANRFDGKTNGFII